MPYGKCYAIMNVSIVEQSLQLTASSLKVLKKPQISRRNADSAI